MGTIESATIESATIESATIESAGVWHGLGLGTVPNQRVT